MAIIGTGIGGLVAALYLKENFSIACLSKGETEDTNTNQAQGGLAAALESDDDPELHLKDTLQAGRELCRMPAAEILVSQGPSRVRDLMDRGMEFDREGGELALAREGGHGRFRVLHARGDATGAALQAFLTEQVRDKENTSLLSQHRAEKLLCDVGWCTGVLCRSLEDGGLVHVEAKAVILAAGGAGQLFPRTSNEDFATGDGMALALRAGALLNDMEFFQFHPTCLSDERGGPFLISEAVRGEGALLRNDKGRRFLADFHPQAELAPRDVVSRGIYEEMQSRGTDRVFLDMTGFGPDKLQRRFPGIYKELTKRDYSPSCEYIPVAPAAHYYMGGVTTDTEGRTSLPGLFAVAETACTGVHGANRLGLVFGSRTAAAANSRWEEIEGRKRWRFHAPRSRRDVSVPSDVFEEWPPSHESSSLSRQQLQRVLWQGAGISRRADGLERTKRRIMKAFSPGQMLSPPPDGFEVGNMALVGLMMVQAALLRRESRGAHYRSDHPRRREKWKKRIFWHRDVLG